MPALFKTLAIAIMATAVSAWTGTGTGSTPEPTYKPAPYGNGTAPYSPHPTGYDHYTTTTVCQTKTFTDTNGQTSYSTIPLYTTVVPLITKTIYAESCPPGSTETATYPVDTTVVPITTYYPQTTVVPGVPAGSVPGVPAASGTGTGSTPAYTTYATGAAPALKISGLAAAAGVVVALLM